MRIQILIIAVVLFAAFMMCTPINAATEQWSSGTYNDINQIFADGSGGCAFRDNGIAKTNTIVWINNKGKMIYKKSFPDFIKIVTLSKKRLVYFINDIESYFIIVDKKGVETIVAKLGADLGTIAEVNVLVDKKGFFVEDKTNGKVIRYTYK